MMTEPIFFFQVAVFVGLVVGFGVLALGMYLELASKGKGIKQVRGVPTRDTTSHI